MKASEMMTSDWVMPLQKRFRGIPGQVVTIDGGTDICWIDCDDYSCLIPCGDVEGIPIAPEILEKNGWKGWIEHSTIARSISVLIEGNTNLCIQEVKGQDAMFVQISHCGAGTYEFRKHLKYVHELQHALRLCGIDKEIIV